jgi:hypothetical protein
MKSKIIEVRGIEIEVHENGRAYSVPHTCIRGYNHPRREKGQSNRGGYRQVGIYGANKVSAPIGVHRLVAQAFLPEWREDWHVDHIDMDKTNNNAYNLRMMSPSDHMKSHNGHYGRRLVGGTGSLKWVDGHNDIYYEKKLDGFAYLFKHEDGMAYGGYFKTAEQAKESCEARKQELG